MARVDQSTASQRRVCDLNDLLMKLAQFLQREEMSPQQLLGAMHRFGVSE